MLTRLKCNPPLCCTGHLDSVCRDHSLLPRSFEPSPEQDSLLSCLFTASTDYSFTRSGKLLFIDCLTHARSHKVLQ